MDGFDRAQTNRRIKSRLTSHNPNRKGEERRIQFCRQIVIDGVGQDRYDEFMSQDFPPVGIDMDDIAAKQASGPRNMRWRWHDQVLNLIRRYPGISSGEIIEMTPGITRHYVRHSVQFLKKTGQVVYKYKKYYPITQE